MRIKFTLLFLLINFSLIFSQLSLPSGTSYTEDFDNLASGLPTGWTVRTSATATSRGTAAAEPSASTWNDTGGAFKNFAAGESPLTSSSTTANQNAATDRALGVRQTGSFADPGASFELELENTVGKRNFNLSMKHQMLSVQPRSTTWSVQYSLDGTTYTTLGTYIDPSAWGSTDVSYSFGTGIDNAMSNVYIRVVALTNSTGSGVRDSYGMDDINLSWEYYQTNDICSSPILFADGVPGILSNISFDGTTSSTEADGSCDMTGEGDLFYSVISDSDGTNNEIINISVEPTSNLDVAVYAYDACGGSVLVCANAQSAGGTENITISSVNLRNHKFSESRDAQPFIIRVDHTGTGTFNLSASGTALPITMASDMIISIKDNQVTLSWTTLQEVNNSHFEILHSTDGRNFNQIGEVAGSGTTNESKNYSIVHNTPRKGINYYKLVQVDYDGRFEEFNVKTAVVGSSAKGYIYPTAIENGISLMDFESSIDMIYVYNNLGQMVKKSTFVEFMDMTELPAGKYTIIIGNQHFGAVKL